MNASQTKKARILVISPWETMWSLGGEDGVRAGVSDDHYFVDGFTRAGYDLHFLVPRSKSKSTGFEGVTRHHYFNFFRATERLPVPLKRLLLQPLFNVFVVPRALGLAHKHRVDVVLGHSHYSTVATWMVRSWLSIASAVKLFGVMDLVHTEWPWWKYLYKNFEQLVALRFPQDAWIILDDGTRGDRAARAQGVPEDRIYFLPNGVNLDWLRQDVDRDEARRTFDVPEGAKVMLFLARLVPSKRPQAVIAALPEIVRRVPDAILLIAGDGPEGAKLRSHVRLHGLSEHVRFLGVVPHHEVPLLMAASDVFVTTSNLTNMALPTCEALICGVPTVAYDVGDTQKLVRPNETGVVVPDGDVEALTDALARILEDDDRREHLAAGARKIAGVVLTSWDDRIRSEMAIVDGLAVTMPGSELEEENP